MDDTDSPPAAACLAKNLTFFRCSPISRGSRRPVIPNCHRIARSPIGAVEGLYLATLGGAEDRIGSLEVGREADIAVLDPNATPLLAFRTRRSRSFEETLFSLMTLGDDRAVRATYVAGELAHARPPVDG